MSEGQENLRGRVAALAVDFGTRARNGWASIERLLDSGQSIDVAELDTIGKTWADASAMLWSVLGSAPKHDVDRTIVRIGLDDLSALLAREEQLARRVAELEAALADEDPRTRNIFTSLSREKIKAEERQDIPSLYIAGGSSERMTVGRMWIDRALEVGARITFDWSRANGYDGPSPTESLLLGNAMIDVQAVMSAGVFWLLAPEALSEGASTELGVAIAAAVGCRIGGKPRARIVVSGPHARRNLFALLADEIYETHEQAWDAIRPLVASEAST